MLFAIGDIHGCAAELRLLLNTLPLSPDTTVVFLGDYVDRGPDSKGVISTILELRNFCNVVTLMGNHEEMFLDYLDNPTSRGAGMFIYNGGSATLASYSDGDGEWFLPAEHEKFFRSLRLSYETEHDFFVHAGVPNIPISDINPKKHGKRMLWTRGPFLESNFKWEKMVVHGHTHVRQVEFYDNRINVDTGCVYRNKLSAIALPGHQVFSISRQREKQRVVLRDDSSRRAAIRFKGKLQVDVVGPRGVHHFETIDYSELGMYMRELDPSNPIGLAMGESIKGVIGPDEESRVYFEGRIVRVAPAPEGTHYAVQIDA